MVQHASEHHLEAKVRRIVGKLETLGESEALEPP